MIGIGGVSMSALALFFQERGFSVCGCDAVVNEYTVSLDEKGIDVSIGSGGSRVESADAVICSSAISENNEDVCRARQKNIPVYTRAQALAYAASCFENSIGIAGCHGKTTATAMCAHVLRACSGNCSAHIGGRDLTFGNYYGGGDKYFVTEACEYKGNFLSLDPSVAVVLNTDKDHLECYGSEDRLLGAYIEYLRKAPAAIVCGDDKIARRVPYALTFGIGSDCDVSASNVRSSRGRYSFNLRIFGKLFDRIRLNVYGKHNIYNALAASSVGVYYGYPSSFIAEGLHAFQGVRRRFERLGNFCGAEVIADYAHHPGEIAAAIVTAAEMTSGKLFVVFQPHTYSRTKLLFDDFLTVLAGVERLVIYKTFPAREYYDESGSALTLSRCLPNSLYVESMRETEIYLRRSVALGDTVLFLGAGDIYYVAEQIVRRRNILF